MENQKQKSQKRAGTTKITSVSITEHMDNLINDYHLSPTEVFRKGLGVSLAELNVYKYVTPLNKERMAQIGSILKIELFKSLRRNMTKACALITNILEELNENNENDYQKKFIVSKNICKQKENET